MKIMWFAQCRDFPHKVATLHKLACEKVDKRDDGVVAVTLENKDSQSEELPIFFKPGEIFEESEFDAAQKKVLHFMDKNQNELKERIEVWGQRKRILSRLTPESKFPEYKY